MRTDSFPIVGGINLPDAPGVVELFLAPGENVLTMTPDEARLIATQLMNTAERTERTTALITVIGRDEFERRCDAHEDPFGEYAGVPIELWRLH